MPDLTSSPIGGVDAVGTIGSNYRRPFANFSRFGTRKLSFYRIEIAGVDENTMNTLFDNENTYDTNYPEEWIETPKNILEAVQRGVQIMAEPYMFSDWDWDQDGQNYYYLYVTAVVADDTIADQLEQATSGYPINFNSNTLEDAIISALGEDFNWDNVYVTQCILRGDYLDQNGPNALGKGSETAKSLRSTARAARIAAGKNGTQRG